ncbi:hypothetical protein AJ79_03659 [Helicocarpus griseus UAMH5409]|uniref:Invertebrate defensins family profile domain-containing protein n=1 Tax=Helicocarpus griseus UAMH5409 TaxID=1447875 RepID=A0A2B7XWK3_9EURO|nr:hypothetical protein AJ79_03659 [Helicocarpus griseus UAMH5409]
MRFSTVFAVVSALSMTALALPSPVTEDVNLAEREAAPEPMPEELVAAFTKLGERSLEGEEDNVIAKRGFGCTIWGGNDKPCHRHCKSIKGYKGGYCKVGGVCKCY